MTFMCPICLEEEETSIEFTGTLEPCSHKFHSHCLRRWHLYAHDLLCPICRIESTSLLIRLSENRSEAPIRIDLRKGFNTRKVLESQQQEEEFSRRFNDALRIGSPLTQQERLVLTQCNICGESESHLDRACHSCGTLFHESCLRSLACEVGDPLSWQQCVECRDQVSHFYQSYDRNSLQFSDEFSRLREVKQKIQEHVRHVLKDISRNANHGNSVISIDKKHFTDINKQVSRKLYRISNYRYLRGIVDYDLEAQREVRLELYKLGYIDI